MKKPEEIMTQNPACLTPEDTVAQAAQIMKRENVGPVPIVENNQTRVLVGIITDRDIVVKAIADNRPPESTKIREVMTPNPICAFPDDDLEDVLDRMESNQVRRIPVVDRDNRLIGIIAQADIATRLDKDKKTGQMVEEISKK